MESLESLEEFGEVNTAFVRLSDGASLPDTTTWLATRVANRHWKMTSKLGANVR